MRLIIRNPNNQDYNDFCRYLIQYFSKILPNISNISAKLILKWNKYLLIVFSEIPNININYILKLFFENLIYYKTVNNDYVLTINKNIKISDNISIEKIVQTIDVGTLDILGIDITEQTYQEVANILDELYIQWEER